MIQNAVEHFDMLCFPSRTDLKAGQLSEYMKLELIFAKK